MVDIKRVIKQKNVLVRDLAKILKVSNQTVYYYINQADKNSVDNLIKIAAALKVPLSELFGQSMNEINCPYCGRIIKSSF